MDKNGFSLIELVLIIAIAVILAVAASLNQIRSYDTLKLDAAAQRIASDLRYAQQLVMDRAPVTTQQLDDCNNLNTLMIQFCPCSNSDPATCNNCTDQFTSETYPPDSYKVRQVNSTNSTPIIDPTTKQPFLIQFRNLAEYGDVRIWLTTLNCTFAIGTPLTNSVMFSGGTGFPGTVWIWQAFYTNFCPWATDFDGTNHRYIQLSYKGKNRYIVIQPETGEINVQNTQP